MMYERDRKANAPCWICGQPIDYRAEPPAPDAWEPDHVIPVAVDPSLAYDLGNIRPSHCSCNRSRGKKADGNGLGSPSREW